jgi:hypothetical protein
MSRSFLKLLVIAFLFCVVFSQTTNQADTKPNEDDNMFKSFLNFIKEFNKTYTCESDMHQRFEIYKNNLKKNGLSANETENKSLNDDDFQKGITKFSDLTDKEFQAFLLAPQNTTSLINATRLFDPDTDLPAAPVVQAEADFLQN